MQEAEKEKGQMMLMKPHKKKREKKKAWFCKTDNKINHDVQYQANCKNMDQRIMDNALNSYKDKTFQQMTLVQDA